MTAVALRWADDRLGPANLLEGYRAYVDALPVNTGSRCARVRAARAFVHRNPDLSGWMSRATPVRLGDLHRGKAWPFLSWLILEGQLRPDVELLLGKPGGTGLPTEWATRHGADRDRLIRAGRQLGWSENWVRQVSLLAASTLCLHAGVPLDGLRDEHFTDLLAELDRAGCVSVSARRKVRTRLFALRQACYQLGVLARPPRKGGPVAGTPAEHARAVRQPEVRPEVVRYVTTISTTLRPTTVAGRTKALLAFFDYLADQHPQVRRLDQLERTTHIEPYLAWVRYRPWRGANGRGRTVSLSVVHQDVVDVRCFFDDIACWGWASAPARRLLFASDLPRLPEPMPRALPPDVDRALMAAVADLDDLFTRTGLRLLRATGLRVGELLDLELDCLVDFAGHGTWLRVPVGKLGTERMVPLEPDILAVLDAWTAQRDPQRALPHPRDGRPTEFLFCERGKRPTAWRLRQGLLAAVAAADLRDAGGSLLHVTPHRLRHTFGTSLINGGIGLPALMALMGHVTPEMTLRYARLASPTIRTAYQQAMDKIRAGQALPLVAMTPAPPVPDRVEWLHAEMVKTRLAAGYCARHRAAGPCPYANICEQCDSFIPATDAAATLDAQLHDVRALQQDAATRGWTDEAARHDRVAASLERHRQRLPRQQPSRRSP